VGSAFSQLWLGAIGLGLGLLVAAGLMLFRLWRRARARRGAWLEFSSGPLAGQRVALVEPEITIGSIAGNSVVLPDPAVSRQHLAIRCACGRYRYRDLGSTNGVYLNGVRWPGRVLREGDVLRVGNSEMVFRTGAAPDTAAPGQRRAA
jgi:hypothetical protein